MHIRDGITLSKTKINLTPGQQVIVPLYGSKIFNMFLTSILQGIAYVYLSGSSNDNIPDFLFSPTANPERCLFAYQDAPAQITISNPGTINGNVNAVNLIGTIYVMYLPNL